ncbi:sialin-like [Watersipora subatra]|uniref:sialin-like n=1 Tax=Watersipora subatra TaxID=2589382 RepID=UPI00355BDD77
MLNSYGFSQVNTIVALCAAANFINAADRVIMPTAIIPMSQQFKWSLHGQGWILSSFSVGYMASGILGASAAKRYGGKFTLLVAVLLWSLSTFITPYFADSLWKLIGLRVLLGIGEGLGLPTIFHIFSHAIGAEHRSTAFGYLIACGSIGQTLSSIICPHLDWKWMFYAFGSLGFIWCILWLLFYIDINPASIQEYEEQFEDPSKSSSSLLSHWREFVQHWALWSLYIAHFTMNWSNYIVMHWLPTYMKASLNAEHRDIMYTAAPYILNSITGVAAGHVADRLISQYRWPILKVRRLMTGIGLIGPGVLMLWFSVIDNLMLALFCVTISMGLSACNSAGHLSNHADVAPNFAGTTFAISNTLATIPGILCGPLTAELVTQSGNRWFPVFIIAAFMNFLGGIIYLGHSSDTAIL